MAACSTTPVLNSFLQNFMIPADGENVYIIDWWEQDFKRHFKQITIDHAKEKKDDFNKIVNFKEFEKVFRCKTIQKN